MNEKYSRKQISEFWTQQAKKHGPSPKASWSDQMVIEMEIKKISKQLEDGDKVLDVGCANGYSTVQFAVQKRLEIRGVDVIPEMIEQARLRIRGLNKKLLGKVEFALGDVTALDEPSEVYGKVLTTRVLINLGNWNYQKKGLQECLRVLKPGGMLLLSEATLQGWRKLNGFRAEWGLPEIPMPPFNLYLDQHQVIKTLSSKAQLVEIVNFSSTYYVGTRILKPLFIQLLRKNIDVADPGMDWNQWFAHLPSWGDYGVQKLFIFRKK